MIKLLSCIIFSFVGVAVILIGVQLIRIMQATQKLTYDQKPFVRRIPGADLSFLFLGDSTALGTGSSSNVQSVAGWFGQDFPQASIDNKGANGKKLVELAAELSVSGVGNYDLVVIQIGANDIMKFSSFSDIDQQISTIIKRAKKIAKNVVILHSGNVGLAPVFIWPFNEIMTWRARMMRALYMKKAKETGVLYVDLFTERANDLFLKNIKAYYSPDHLHPSGQGYRWWYDRIRSTMNQAGVTLSLSSVVH